jgi:protein SCO1/2
MKNSLWFIGLLALLCADNGYSHETLEPSGAAGGEIGIEEKLGQVLPPGIVFHDENGAEVKVGSLFGKPVILTLVYYTCEHICPLMLGGLAQALPRLVMTPGKDYRLITVSFDATDTPQIAGDIKKNYIKASGSLSAEEGWTFLVGDQKNIDQLTKAVGFTYRKDVHGFNHPVALIFLSPAGKISQYLQVTKYGYGAEYPITFSSFDLNMALTEAAQGKSVTGLKKALLYCFSHEPPGQSKFFNFIALVGLVTLLAMAAFFAYLQVSSRRYRRLRGYDDER